MESPKKRLGVFREITRDLSPKEDFPSHSEENRQNPYRNFENPTQTEHRFNAGSAEFLSLYDQKLMQEKKDSVNTGAEREVAVKHMNLYEKGTMKGNQGFVVNAKNSQSLSIKHLEADTGQNIKSTGSPVRAISPTFKVPKDFSNAQKYCQKGNISQYQRKLATPTTFIARNRGFNFDSSLEGSGFLSNRSVNMKISTEESSREETEERRKPKKRPLEESEKNFYVIRLDIIASGRDTRTTVMIKNIPNKYTQRMLLQTIDKKFSGTYDFLYLPIDFKNRCNVGYAFINFLNFRVIVDFFKEFNDKRWEKFNSEKICALAYARIQGLQDLVHHFQNSSVINQEDNKVKPIILSKN
ncbi:hypothetical protein SteCoe_8158 [Stentor coeruleus]|uniref:Mei2-like C-terminal RNA recognition motif domain-containing protein n=1 Tax=Stentor coeruleus TaxID=5963 RepID=A0A1R2CKS3_9CILI|nr:hypothetical protein SteCoe_8158 [Stentor coeruleus]